MTVSRRLFVQIATGASGLLALQPKARAQAFPSRPVKFIAPWPVGGAVDALSRVVASRLEPRLGQPVVTENRPGAGSTLGVAAGAKSTPDGYTLVLAGNSALAISPVMFKKLPYDPIKDFSPVALIARIPMVLVTHPSMPFKTVAELIHYARENPKKLNYGSGGHGSSHQMVMEMFRGMTGIDITHVPYNGSAPAMNDLVAGHIQLLFSDPLPAPPQIKAGNARALGVSSAGRWNILPDIPTVAEGGVPGFDAVNWTMAMAPAGTPSEVVDRLAADFRTIARTAELREQVEKLGMVPVESPSPAELRKFVASEVEKWGAVVRQAGLAGTL